MNQSILKATTRPRVYHTINVSIIAIIYSTLTNIFYVQLYIVHDRICSIRHSIGYRKLFGRPSFQAKSQYIVSARTRIDDRFFALNFLLSVFFFFRLLSYFHPTRSVWWENTKHDDKKKNDGIISTCRYLMVINIIFTLSNRKCQQNPVWISFRWGPSLLIIHIATFMSSIDHAM